MMSTKCKTKLIFAISILTISKLLENGQYFVRSQVSANLRNGLEWKPFTLSNDFNKKLDKLDKAVGALQKNMNSVMSEMEELKSLRQMVRQSHPGLPSERKDRQNSKLNILEVKCAGDRLPENCYQVNECQQNVYSIAIPNFSENAFPVSCDFKTADSGWTVIQRRQDGSVNFFRNWTEYVEGFGDLNGEFFIGLEKLHALTTQGGAQELHIILEDFEGDKRYAKYKMFRIDSNETDYKLTVGNYSGDAGDSFSSHSGYKFSTWDRDNDDKVENCAESRRGAWWYHSCYNSNLNGEYLMGKISSKLYKGIAWGDFRGVGYSLKYTQMMIRPCQD